MVCVFLKYTKCYLNNVIKVKLKENKQRKYILLIVYCNKYIIESTDSKHIMILFTILIWLHKSQHGQFEHYVSTFLHKILIHNLLKSVSIQNTDFLLTDIF